MSQLDFDNLIEQTSHAFIARLDGLALSSEEYESNCNIIGSFTGIATQQLASEPGLEGPDPANPIPLDDKMIVQGLTLFCEGLYNALAKCAEMGITGQLKQQMIETLAMHVYEQGKQLVAATYGQEHTPEFQFTHEQQVDIIHKAAEGYLIAIVTEYENEYGPIVPPETHPAMAQAMSAPSPQADYAASVQPQAQSMPQQTALPSRPQGANPHDKYAAVALLLTTLPTEQRARILRAFDDEEKELITYYSYPQHVEQNLDISCVQEHLKKLKETLQKANPSFKSEAYKGILALVESNPPEKLLSWVKDERPLVKKYLQAHYQRKSGQVQNPDGSNAHVNPLPPRIEEILYGYLAKRLKPA